MTTPPSALPSPSGGALTFVVLGDSVGVALASLQGGRRLTASSDMSASVLRFPEAGRQHPIPYRSSVRYDFMPWLNPATVP